MAGEGRVLAALATPASMARRGPMAFLSWTAIVTPSVAGQGGREEGVVEVLISYKLTSCAFSFFSPPVARSAGANFGTFLFLFSST